MRRIILQSFQSPGDVVMLTAAVRDLHAAAPGQFQTDVRTSADDLWRNNPRITPLSEADPNVETIDMHYPLVHQSNQRPYHFLHGYTQFLEERLDLRIPVTRFQGDIHLADDERGGLPAEWNVPERFWIVVAGGKHDFTAKWWNPASYQAVVDHFSDKMQFVQCGEAGHWHPPLDGVVNLVGKTSLREFVRLMHHAEGVLCPVTLAMHLAAAIETRPGRPTHRPCVVVAGGREPQHWEAYPHHRFLSTVGTLSCCAEGGCWKSRCQLIGDGDDKDRRNVCEQPVQLTDDLRIPRCLDMISAEDVIRSIRMYTAEEARFDGVDRNKTLTEDTTQLLNQTADTKQAECPTTDSNGQSQPVDSGRNRLLVETRHTEDQLSDVVVVLRHLQHYYVGWQIDVVIGAECHDVLRPYCGQLFNSKEESVDRSRYERVVQVKLPSCRYEYPHWPSTAATRFLLEELRLTPIPDLCRETICRITQTAVKPDAHQIAENGREPTTPRLLVLGDLILDRYIWGDAERVSPEAPVLVLKSGEHEIRTGGAASVAALLRGLEAEAIPVGVIGDDAAGRQLTMLLDEAGIDTTSLVRDADRSTTTKERFMGRAAGRHPHQILRVDTESTESISEDIEAEVLTQVTRQLHRCDVLLVSDYAKGVCTPRLLSEVIQAASQRHVPVIIDPARIRDYSRYTGADVITPNRVEAELANGRSIHDPGDALHVAARLCQENSVGAVILTLDRDGMVLATSRGDRKHYPTRERSVYDITGAGDTVLAVVGHSQSVGMPLADSIQLANVAAGLQVERLGVAAVTREEIDAEHRTALNDPPGKLVTSREMSSLAERYRQQGRRVVFTNGCFDLLHVGHVRCLQEAAQLGDVLIVGVNCDEVVTELKGCGRPLIKQDDRAKLLAALGCVDHVIIFDEPTPHRLLRQLRPDVLVKGGTTASVVGEEVVKAYGGQVVLTTELNGISTTTFLETFSRFEAGTAQAKVPM